MRHRAPVIRGGVTEIAFMDIMILALEWSTYRRLDDDINRLISMKSKDFRR